MICGVSYVIKEILNVVASTYAVTGGLSAAFVKSISGRIIAMIAHRPLAGGVAAISTGAVIGNYTQDWTDSPALYLYLANPREEY